MPREEADAKPAKVQLAPLLAGQRCLGVVKNYNGSTGFGFITCAETQHLFKRDVFLQRQEVVNSGAKVGSTVSFTIELNKDGKPQARNVEVMQPAVPEVPDDTEGGSLSVEQQMKKSFLDMMKVVDEYVDLILDNQIFIGVVKSFNQSNGFGFISCEDTGRIFGRDVFLHHTQVGELWVGDSIKFRLEIDPLKGTPRAKDIEKCEGKPNGPDIQTLALAAAGMAAIQMASMNGGGMAGGMDAMPAMNPLPGMAGLAGAGMPDLAGMAGAGLPGMTGLPSMGGIAGVPGVPDMPGMAGMAAGMAGVPGLPGVPGMPNLAAMGAATGAATGPLALSDKAASVDAASGQGASSSTASPTGAIADRANGAAGAMVAATGIPGVPDMAGLAGMAGVAGMPDMTAVAGMAGMPGVSMTGMPGMPGVPGMPDMSAMAGMPGLGALGAVGGVDAMGGMMGMDPMSMGAMDLQSVAKMMSAMGLKGKLPSMEKIQAFLENQQRQEAAVRMQLESIKQYEKKEEPPEKKPASSGMPQAPPPEFDVKQRFVGIINKFNRARGFGFIKCDETYAAYGDDVFLHNEQREGFEVGDVVSFALEIRGTQARAKDLRAARDKSDKGYDKEYDTSALDRWGAMKNRTRFDRVNPYTQRERRDEREPTPPRDRSRERGRERRR